MEETEFLSRLSQEHYALETTGCEVVSRGPRHAICQLPNLTKVQNGMGNPMGGALYTLGDFTFGVAANHDENRVCVTQSASVSYLRSTKGKMLTAEAECLHDGRSTCVYAVTIRDEAGTLLSHMTFTGFYLDPKGK